jgi:ribosome-binding factor A
MSMYYNVFYLFIIFADMESTRQKKISRLMQKDLGEIIQMESKNWVSGAMITVTKVNVTSDLSLARVYLSIFGKDAASVVEVVQKNTKVIRKKLGDRVKNQVRIIPQLRFFIDDSLDYLENIENLLKE